MTAIPMGFLAPQSHNLHMRALDQTNNRNILLR